MKRGDKEENREEMTKREKGAFDGRASRRNNIKMLAALQRACQLSNDY